MPIWTWDSILKMDLEFFARCPVFQRLYFIIRFSLCNEFFKKKKKCTSSLATELPLDFFICCALNHLAHAKELRLN